MAGGDLPLVCRLDALNREEQSRLRDLLRALGASVQQIREMGDGLELRLADDPVAFHQLTEWIPLERRCCPFLSFRLDWEAAGAVRLQITGPPGVKDFLRTEIARPAGQID